MRYSRSACRATAGSSVCAALAAGAGRTGTSVRLPAWARATADGCSGMRTSSTAGVGFGRFAWTFSRDGRRLAIGGDGQATGLGKLLDQCFAGLSRPGTTPGFQPAEAAVPGRQGAAAAARSGRLLLPWAAGRSSHRGTSLFVGNGGCVRGPVSAPCSTCRRWEGGFEAFFQEASSSRTARLNAKLISLQGFFIALLA